MRFDLKKACKHCPFMDTPERISFACLERAQDIEEEAYRRGFPCHEHAECVEEEDDLLGGGGFYERQDGSTQHCWGALAMYLQSGDSSVPWEQAIEDDESLEKRWWDRASIDALNKVFQQDEFFVANTP